VSFAECHCAEWKFTKCCYAEYHHAKCQILQSKRLYQYSTSLSLVVFKKPNKNVCFWRKIKAHKTISIFKLLCWKLCLNYYLNDQSTTLLICILNKYFARCHWRPLSNLWSLQVQQLQPGVQLHQDDQGH